MVLQGGEPFFLQGGKHGVILTHGFTGTPAEMLLLGRYLHAQGYTVLGIRLAGHGTTPEAWHEQVGRNGMILSVMAILCWQAVVTKYLW